MNTTNTLLYGKDDETGIVGLHLEGDEQIRLYTRSSDGTLNSRVEPFYPFFFAAPDAVESIAENFRPTEYWHRPLNGDGGYSELIVMGSWRLMWEAVKSVDKLATYLVPQSASQYLMQTGKTLFGGMLLDDAHRLQVDIEVYSSEGGFVQAQREADQIIIISLHDNRGFQKVLHIHETAAYRGNEWMDEGIYEWCVTEPTLIETFVKYVQKLDPDIIEGHNIFGFDLPYLRDRAARWDVNFAIGRDKKPPKSWKSSKDFAERTFEYEQFDVAGRSIIDTMFLAIDRDVYTRDLPGYGLKEIAKHYDIAAPDRQYIAGDKISWYWDNEPAPLLKYALDDVIETEALGRQLAQSAFYLTKMLPMDYQRSHTAGTSASIESLFVREYLRCRQSLPKRTSGKGGYTGGYTDIFQTGVFTDLAYLDVDSLYPSIMLNFGIRPESDELYIFKPLLQSLTDLRFATKGRMKAEKKGTVAYDALDAEQSSYKILINSFYGMLGFPFALFSDIAEANRVTVTGQKLLKKIMAVITEYGGDVVLCDTDGVLFRLPRSGMADEEVDQLASMVTNRLPKGIKVSNDGRYEAVLAYAKKNYVLKEAGEKPKFKGVSFKGRSLEPFGVKYIREVATALLERDVQKVYEIHRATKHMIVNREWTVADFQKRGSLKKTITQYKSDLEKPNNKHQAVYELAIKREEEDGVKAYSGDVLNFYVSGDKKAYKVRTFEDAKLSEEWTHGDENTNHYLKRLKTFAKKFKGFFTDDDFKIIFDMTVDPEVMTAHADVSNVEILNTRLKNVSDVTNI